MMPLIDLEFTELTRRRRSLPVAHRETSLAEPLETGACVVVRDARSGDFHSATVADVDLTPQGTRYRLELGIRLPEEVALDRIRHDRPTHDDGLMELLDLIGAAREELGDAPSPRGQLRRTHAGD